MREKALCVRSFAFEVDEFRLDMVDDEYYKLVDKTL